MNVLRYTDYDETSLVVNLSKNCGNRILEYDDVFDKQNFAQHFLSKSNKYNITPYSTLLALFRKFTNNYVISLNNKNLNLHFFRHYLMKVKYLETGNLSEVSYFFQVSNLSVVEDYIYSELQYNY